MSFRALLFVSVFVSASFTAACSDVGGSSRRCGPSTCDGCCNLAGTCVAGEADDAGRCAMTACSAATCEAAGANCGVLVAGCDCGACADGETCGGGGVANVCGVGSCDPQTCKQLDYECGIASDGCSALVDCGKCASGLSCTSAHQCGQCEPQTCEQLGKNCGMADNGCGDPIPCGACDGFETCGGGGVKNVCGCKPKTCSGAMECGSIDDGCGGMVSCGECSGYQTCGGSGVANQCGASCGEGCPATFECVAGICKNGELDAVTLEETGFAVSGSLQVNGAKPTTSSTCETSYEVAIVRFSEKTKGYSAAISVKCEDGYAWSTLLPPGTYEVRVERGYYAGTFGSNLLPVSYLANPALTISGPLAGQVLNEIGFATSGTIQVNGATPTTTSTCETSYEVAIVRFAEKTKGYSAAISVKCEDGYAWSTLLPPGTYEVRVERGYYAGTFGSNLLPVSYLANPALTVSGPLTDQVLNEIGFAVGGSLQVNSATPTTSSTCETSYEVAIVRFAEKTKGYSAAISVKCEDGYAWSTLLPPGTYEVRVERGYYAGTFGSNLLPVSYLANPALTVTGPLAGQVLNEIGFAVSGTIKVNGATPTTTSTCETSYEVAIVRFAEKTKGYSAAISVKCEDNYAWSTLLPPGTYEVRVERGYYAGTFGSNLMSVSYLANSALTVSGPVAGQVLNEIGLAVSGSIKVNGATPTTTSTCETSYEVAIVRFYEKTKGYSAAISVKCEDGYAWSTLLPAGTYEIRVERGYYAGTFGSNLMPLSYLANKSLTVSAALAGQVLDEIGYAVSGTILVNGATPTTTSTCETSYEVAIVRFSDSVQGYTAAVSLKCEDAYAWSTLLPAGVYDVRVERGYYAGTFGSNLLPVSYLAIPHLAVP